MTDRLQRFISLMREIFELDKSDLDFGIYRIINIRKKAVETFLAKGLPEKIRETLAPFAKDTTELEKRIAEIERQCEELGIDISASKKLSEEYSELKSQIAAGADLSGLELSVYSSLYHFFSRYYEEGDFISKRRYKEGVYALPYEGEEVRLYWANQDQYYVKSSENFRDYTFADSGYTVHFRLVRATTEQNNNKESRENKRVFMLFDEKDECPGIHTFEYNADERKLIICFTYDIPKNKKIKYEEENLAKIRQYLVSDPSMGERAAVLLRNLSSDKKKASSVLEKHLRAYTARNTFNYFIHQDLRGFLYRELDFYIKNEVIRLDDIDTEQERHAQAYIAEARAVKRVGHSIIDFLAQIEDFQKKLWLKKKFVVETNWCITLDKINAGFWKEIISNEKQLEEWIRLFRIDRLPGFSRPLKEEFLRDNLSLVVDTRFYSKEWKDRLLETIDNLDDQTDGIMVRSDNFQALNLLMARYEGTIPLIYIDPPYNTDASKILYKNGYEHSSWLSLMHSRLQLARRLLSSKGIMQVAIDDYEFRYINCCLDQVFGAGNAISNIAIFTNPKGRDQGFIAAAHDYTLMYAKDKRYAETNKFMLSEKEIKKKFAKTNGVDSLRELPLKRTGTGKYREERPYMYFPFLYDSKKEKLYVIEEELYKKIYDPQTESFDDSLIEKCRRECEKKGWAFILPLSGSGERLRWRWGYASCRRGIENGSIFAKKMKDGSYAVYQYDLADAFVTPKSIWIGERYDASSKGTNILDNILPNNLFDYPKSLYTVEDNLIIGSGKQDTVMDFFAGSATTGHAVIDLNRKEEGSGRKYILIDMGEYFDSIPLARMKKVIYSSEWRDGVPQNRDSGVSHIMKYMTLESYEDALSNIELPKEDFQLSLLLGEEYLIHYMLETEAKNSMLDIERFDRPFEYKLKINQNNETSDKIVDLAETFQYLLGLRVIRRTAVTYFCVSEEKNESYEGAVDIAENPGGPYGFQQIEGILPDGDRVLIIWRTITDDILLSNAALDAYFLKKHREPDDRNYDRIYVNGDNNLAGLKTDRDKWKIHMIEPEFRARMFEEE